MAVSINGCCFCPLSVISAPRPSFPFSYSSFPRRRESRPPQWAPRPPGTSFPLLLFVMPASPIRHSRAGGNPGRLGGCQDLLERHSRFSHSSFPFSYSSFPLLLFVIPAQAGIQSNQIFMQFEIDQKVYVIFLTESFDQMIFMSPDTFD